MDRCVRLVVAGALALAASLLVPGPAGADEDLVVSTAYGEVRGTHNGATDEWRGVPYASPPVGALRWRPPVPPVPWTGVRDAGSFADVCAQPGFETPVEGSEDCLYLNVFLPAGTAPGAGLPVLVHLHPGANFGFHPYTDASALTAQGVAVVTVGYRLGVFGFVGHPALSAENGGASGEYGVLDQIAALHWVHDNIAAFGGDPSRVTLAGESAGSFDAVAIAASPLGHGLFSQLAAQTESFWAGRGVGTIKDAEGLGVEIVQGTSCSDDPDVTGCLRALPTEDLVAAAGFRDVAPWSGGQVLSGPPLELIAQQENPVPMLLGSNREEASWPFYGEFVLGGRPYTRMDWHRDTNSLVGPQNGELVRRLYPIARYGSYLWAAVALTTDAVYTCPMRRLALASHSTVYRYLYTHVYSEDPLLEVARAGHFFDEPILWHDGHLLDGFVGGYAFSADEDALANRMAAYWANFARSGDPNGTGIPDWPTYDAAHERIKVLDVHDATLQGFHVDECAVLDELPALYGMPTEYTPAWPRPWLHRAGGE